MYSACRTLLGQLPTKNTISNPAIPQRGHVCDQSEISGLELMVHLDTEINRDFFCFSCNPTGVLQGT